MRVAIVNQPGIKNLSIVDRPDPEAGPLSTQPVPTTAHLPGGNSHVHQDPRADGPSRHSALATQFWLGPSDSPFRS